jgi:hypothetical protein
MKGSVLPETAVTSDGQTAVIPQRAVSSEG